MRGSFSFLHLERSVSRWMPSLGGGAAPAWLVVLGFVLEHCHRLLDRQQRPYSCPTQVVVEERRAEEDCTAAVDALQEQIESLRREVKAAGLAEARARVGRDDSALPLSLAGITVVGAGATATWAWRRKRPQRALADSGKGETSDSDGWADPRVARARARARQVRA